MTIISKPQKLTESEFQRETQAFVQREVVCCVSNLMCALIAWSPGESFYDFFEIFLQDDEDGEPIEIFEYWFVSNFFAEKLEAKGEVVSHDFFGHCVWGRTTTGQSISMDHVIREIYAELKT